MLFIFYFKIRYYLFFKETNRENYVKNKTRLNTLEVLTGNFKFIFRIFYCIYSLIH